MSTKSDLKLHQFEVTIDGLHTKLNAAYYGPDKADGFIEFKDADHKLVMSVPKSRIICIQRAEAPANPLYCHRCLDDIAVHLPVDLDRDPERTLANLQRALSGEKERHAEAVVSLEKMLAETQTALRVATTGELVYPPTPEAVLSPVQSAALDTEGQR